MPANRTSRILAASVLLLFGWAAAAGAQQPAPSGPLVLEPLHNGFLLAPDVKVTKVDGSTITVEQRKDRRGMRIYADVMRNAYAQTVAASYGVRARDGAPVATPLAWDEVQDEKLEPGRFTLATVRTRLGQGTDPWAEFGHSTQGLSDPGKRLSKLEP